MSKDGQILDISNFKDVKRPYFLEINFSGVTYTFSNSSSFFLSIFYQHGGQIWLQLILVYIRSHFAQGYMKFVGNYYNASNKRPGAY